MKTFPATGTLGVVQDLLKNLDPALSTGVGVDHHNMIYNVLQDSDKEEIVRASLLKFLQAEELKPFQAELIKLQRHLEKTRKKMDSRRSS
jgi:hypothetical protein